jgi:hypothetical protein
VGKAGQQDAQRTKGSSRVIPKENAYRSNRWLRAVASLPCVACGKEGQTQAAHRNQGKGMGIKTDDCFIAALCQECHAGIDSGSMMTKQERRERMDWAILMTLRALVQAGMVAPK